MKKTELRHNALEARRSLPSAHVAELSERVRKSLVELKEFEAAKLVASYVAKADEVQTAAIIEQSISEGKKVIVPLVDRSSNGLLFFKVRALRDLSPGTLGILEPKPQGEPVPLKDADLVLVPVVAWDARGHRVGHGKGYFDRALAKRGDSLAVGLAFESQSVPHVPDEAHDIQLDVLVTDKAVRRFGRSAA